MRGAKPNTGVWDVKNGEGRGQDIDLVSQMLALRAASPARATGQQIQAAQRAGLIAKPDADALSGGETARLLFCRIMLQKPNILVFDEPTNHLDLESINALNVALQKFEGTVLLVTHDQDLMEEVGTRVWHFADGRIEDFKGPYEEFESVIANR